MKKPRTARAEIERLRTELEESVRLHFAAHQRMERAEARLQWVEDNLLGRKWDGTIGRPSYWEVYGDYRHRVQVLRGESLSEAIDAALHAALDALLVKAEQ